jgi:hypothetical protein
MQDPTTHVRIFSSTSLQPPALGLKKPSGKKGALASCPQETTQNHDQREKEKKPTKKRKPWRKNKSRKPIFLAIP